MHQTELSHRYLLQEALLVRATNPVEFYSSYKRVFEYFLNRRMNDASIKAYGLFIKSFVDVQSSLPSVSKLSFMKNIGHYFLTVENWPEAQKILTIALQKAMNLRLTGQILQISTLLKNAQSSNNVLITYKFE